MYTHPRLIGSVMIAFVLLLHMTSALASSTPDDRHKHDTIVTFTKWVTAVVPPIPGEATASRFLMAGIVGGDVAGDFVGEVLDRRVSTTGTVTAQIVALDALYEIQAGDHSFTALIQGGQNNLTRKALLDGVILDAGGPAREFTWSSLSLAAVPASRPAHASRARSAFCETPTVFTSSHGLACRRMPARAAATRSLAGSGSSAFLLPSTIRGWRHGARASLLISFMRHAGILRHA